MLLDVLPDYQESIANLPVVCTLSDVCFGQQDSVCHASGDTVVVCRASGLGGTDVFVADATGDLACAACR